MTRMRIVAAALLAVTLGACSDSQLAITNPNSPTVAAAAGDPSSLQLLTTGLLANYRSGRAGLIQDVGIFGREAYNYFPTDGRFTSHYLIGISVGGQQVIDPTGFASGDWATQYNALRNIYNFKKTVSTNTTLTDAQKNAALGFARTLEGQMLYELLMTRDSVGIVVEIKDNASDLAAFVSRDSAYKYVLATFDDAATKLAAGGSAFPFTLHSGFTGFNTPATFVKYTQALKGRVAVNYAAITNSAAMYNTALTALNASFLNLSASNRAGLDNGVYHVYSTASGDQTNGLNTATNLDLYAHMSIATDAEAGDLRYAAKILTGQSARTPAGGIGVTSTLRFNIWANASTPISSIRNEELIALHAEASLGAGAPAAAISDINILRTVSGGLPVTTLTPASGTPAILAGILKEKRMSTLMEGNRWVDMRKYGLLAQLPLDITTGANKHFVAKVIPVPQAECLSRAGKVAPFAGPGC